MKLILSSFKANIDANNDQANVIGIDANDADINEIFWNIEQNPEYLDQLRLPNVIGQAEHFEINNEMNNFGDLIQWIINNRVTILVSKYATGG